VSASLRFWGSAAVAALLYAALVPVLFPFGATGMDPATERDRVWLVVVFYTGVLALLFGLAALISGPRLIGTRDVAEAGSVGKAVEAARRSNERLPERRAAWRNFASWVIAFGAALVLCYFALWGALG
jgi:hypothetical protein